MHIQLELFCHWSGTVCIVCCVLFYRSRFSRCPSPSSSRSQSPPVHCQPVSVSIFLRVASNCLTMVTIEIKRSECWELIEARSYGLLVPRSAIIARIIRLHDTSVPIRLRYRFRANGSRNRHCPARTSSRYEAPRREQWLINREQTKRGRRLIFGRRR